METKAGDQIDVMKQGLRIEVDVVTRWAGVCRSKTSVAKSETAVPRWGTVDAEITLSSAENLELSMVPF